MKTAMIVVDVQNDFCEGGSLAVAGGAAVAAAVSKQLRVREYDLVVATRDWHVDPGTHFSADPDFADSWPVHCAVGTLGAEYHPDFQTDRVDVHVVKGEYEAAYSGFQGVDATGRPLLQILNGEEIEVLEVCGIATDYCVKATVLDALKAGFQVRLLLDLVAGVAPESTEAALEALTAAGAQVVTLSDMEEK